MKHKLKKLAVAVTLAVGVGQANAAIFDGTSGNGELFLAAYSPSLQTSYIRDLGIRLNDFRYNGTTAVASGSYAFNPSASLTATTGSVVANGYSLNFLTDSLMVNSLGNGTSLAGDVVWMIGAMDTTGVGLNGQRYLTTVNGGAVGGQLNGQLTQFANINGYLSGNNQLGTNVSPNVNGSAIATPATLQTAAYFPNPPVNTWATWATFDAAGAVGEALPFFFLTPSSTNSTSVASNTQYRTATGVDFAWTLNTDGSLSYAAVPIPAAAWLFGSGLLGLIGIARRRKALAA